MSALEQVDVIVVMFLGMLIFIGGGMFYHILRSKSPEDIELANKLKEIHF